MARRAVQVIHLGRMGFLQANDVQKRYAGQHLKQLAGLQQTEAPDVLLLVQHNPVYTTGAWSDDIDQEENRLKDLGAEFYRTNRHGLMTFHGPGQLVAYPILNLRHFQPSLNRYVASLCSILIDTCRRLGLEDTCVASSHNTAVWVKGKQIGAIGVHAENLVTTHGVSLNCDVDLTCFLPIQPCGGDGKDVTSVSQELGTATPVKKVISPFLDAFGQEFQCEIECSMLDAEDASLLKYGGKEEVERSSGTVTGSLDVAPRRQSGNMSLSSSSSSRPRVVMW